MSETFKDIREALGVIVENYNEVEQYFCNAIAFATNEHVDFSPRIMKARRNMEVLKGLLKETLKPDVEKAVKVVAFDALMRHFDALQQSRNDVIHSR